VCHHSSHIIYYLTPHIPPTPTPSSIIQTTATDPYYLGTTRQVYTFCSQLCLVKNLVTDQAIKLNAASHQSREETQNNTTKVFFKQKQKKKKKK
jgi:hypothetical protein